MAWVTPIVSLDQVNYRLERGAGCWGSEPGKSSHAHGNLALQEQEQDSGHGLEHGGPLLTASAEGEAAEADPALAYRMAAERPLKWFGSGLKEHGLEAGTELVTAADLDAARALMYGASPDGTVRVTPKVANDPRSKLSAAPMIEAIRTAWASTLPAAAGLEGQELTAFAAEHRAALDTEIHAVLPSQHARDLYEQAAAGTARRGDLYVLPAHELERLGELTGVDAAAIYGDDLARAYETGYEYRQVRRDRKTRDLMPKKVTVGTRGFDFTQNLPKSHSVLMAYGPAALATEYEQMLESVLYEGLEQLEVWAGYAQRGHHGGRDADGRPIAAQRIDITGFSGWIAIHRAARPVEGAPVGDPHWHAHAVIAHLVRGVDGQWSTIGSGGLDLFRHARAVDALVQARARWEAGARFGIEFARTSRGVWDISAIPESTITLFSKRDAQVKELFERLQLSYDEASLKARKAASSATRENKTALGSGAEDDALREYWQAEGRAAGDDPDQIAADALAGRAVPRVPSVEEIAAQVFDPENGLTSHDKRFGWVDAYAAVLDACPGGIGDAAAAGRLVAAVLRHGGAAINLPERVPAHMTHPACYTSADVVAAEQTILKAARAGYGSGRAVVDQETAEAVLSAFEAEHDFQLSAEQRAVYFRAVRGGHAVDAVVGVAGAGKTTVMDVVRRAFESAGYTVEGSSTAAVAVDTLRRTAGLGAARTIESYVRALQRDREPLRGVDVLILDEAMMTDDRDMARLLEHAAATGTKILGIGDPRQLRSPGIGGGMAAVHTVVGGVTLTENRRQKDQIERAAIARVREREFGEGLGQLADHGRVQVGRTRDDARAAVLVLWSQARAEHPDPHDQIEHVLVMAATNADVDALNHAARELRRERGELLGEDRLYRIAGGRELELAVNDIILVRQNDYRDGEHHDVYNGTRAVVDAIAEDGTLTVSWREQDADGNTRTITETLSPEFIERGGVSHGLAITGHKSQGLTCSIGIVYGDGMRGNATYEAITRGRLRNFLVYSQEAYEDAETRVRLGDPETAAALTARTIAAVSRELSDEIDESLVSVELGLEQIQVPGTTRKPAAVDDPHAETRAILESVPGLAHLADVILDDPAAAKLTARLAAVQLRGQDPAAALAGVLDPDLPIDQTRRPASVLAWRLARAAQRLSPAAAAPTPAGPPPADRLDTWAVRTAGDLELEEPADVRDLSDQELTDVLRAARAAAHESLDEFHGAEKNLTDLRRQVERGTGPAELRVRGRLENLRGRGEALEEMAALLRQAAPLRAELDALRAAGPTPATSARMAQLRSGLDVIAARYIALDNLAGAPAARDRILLAWRRAQSELPDAIAQAKARDQRRLDAAENSVPRLRGRSRTAAARYAQIVSAARGRGLDLAAIVPQPARRTPAPSRHSPTPARPPSRRPHR